MNSQLQQRAAEIQAAHEANEKATLSEWRTRMGVRLKSLGISHAEISRAFGVTRQAQDKGWKLFQVAALSRAQ